MRQVHRVEDSPSSSSSQTSYIDDVERAEMIAHLTKEELQRREELKSSPMQAELKRLEKRWTKSGHGYITEPRDIEEGPKDEVNWYEKFALCVTQEYDSDNTSVVKTSLQVNSDALKNVLRRVIRSFPGQSFHTSDVSLDYPTRCLFHYLPELEAELTRSVQDDPQSDEAVHLQILVSFVKDHFKETIENTRNFSEAGVINYRYLWTIFKPGCVVYGTFLSQSQAYKLNSYRYTYGCNASLCLGAEFVDFDGDDFGTRAVTLNISQFEGIVPICSLPVVPFHLLASPTTMRELLIARGRKWQAHAGQQFREYDGIALDVNNSRYNVDARVMIDPRTFHRIKANHSFSVIRFPEAKKKKKTMSNEHGHLFPTSAKGENDYSPLTDDQCLLASPRVRGFSFKEKKFLNFFIDNVSPIEWNAACFQQLVLPESQKDLVQALVGEHSRRSEGPEPGGLEDIVKGKSGGLILVLHGPPGVGKTLTAECVAEFCKRPLYSVSSGYLGTDPEKLDDRLSLTLDLACTWNAVLLIDEADVFLEKRSLHDLERNGLVSIFLRTLEYYSGILFMTTNRVRTFDDAFKSRIHVPLRYGPLDEDSRAIVWRNFLTSASRELTDSIGASGIQELAQRNINGRQIKNVVRTAKSLAAHRGVKLDIEQLKQVVDIQLQFEQDLDVAGGDIDQVAS